MALSDTTLRKLKPESKSYKKFDGGGLYIEVQPSGSKLWRIAYRFQNKGKTLYLPAYPAMSLAEAREKLLEVKKLLAQGVDPGEVKRQQAAEREAEEKHEQTTFRYVAELWLKDYANRVTEKQIGKIRRHLELYLYPCYGSLPVMDLKAIKILEPARMKETEGKNHTAHRLVTLAGQVLDHAVLMGLIEYNLARGGLTKRLAPEKTKHHAAITDPREVGELLCDIEDYRGSEVMGYFLKIMPYVFTRNTELRKAEWSEFDLEDEMLWTVPKERMKIKDEDHKVPLAHQVVTLLRELKQVTGHSKFLFPSARANTATLSDAGPLSAIRRMGYDKDTMTIHGFRSTASTCLNERGYSYDHIEKQLAHKEKDEVRAAYNRAEYLEPRRKLIQDWADILDELRQGARERRTEKKEERKQRLAAASAYETRQQT